MSAFEFGTIDLTNCELEPIRFPGTVQPHGAVLVVQSSTGLVQAASESCLGLLGSSATSLLGKHLSELSGVSASATLLADQGVVEKQVVALSRHGKRLSARARRNEAGQTLVDIEEGDGESTPFLYACRRCVEELRRMSELSKIAQAAADAIRELTGYDRVMMYRFDEAWNGEVIGEARVASIEPYLGLHFPASDIPKQARELFQLCRVRLIPDVHYTPSDLVAPSDACSIDLGRSSLRSVSPIHIEYLKNMGVRATLVGALVVADRLWGLVACHHYSGAKYFSPAQRDSLAWLCDDIAALIETTLDRERLERKYSLAMRRRSLLEFMRTSDFKGLMQGHSMDLLNVVGADGFALLVEDSIHGIGVTPKHERIRELQTRRRQRETDPALFASGALFDDLGINDIGDGIAGAIFVSLRDRPDTTLIWFRKERHYSVRWGGDPDHPHTVDESGRLSPRKSFALFMQNIRCRCQPWSAEELDSATELGSLIDIETMREREAFAKTILDSSPDHIAVINPQGIIVEVNNAWKHFARENGAQDVAIRSVGMNYRAICEAATGQPSGRESAPAWAGIEAVLNGTKDNFTLDYPCDSPNGQHWFRMSVYPLIAPGNGAVVAHENITARKQAEEKLREMAVGLETIVANRTRQMRELSSQLAMTEERERRQLAEDLHDNLCQLLAIAKIKLSSLNGGSPSPSVQQVLSLVAQADQSARMITQQLSPPVLRTLGLVPALESLAETMGRMYNMTVDLDFDGSPPVLDDEIQALLYRSIRELLINVAKHAGVSQASISFACNESQLVFAVSDDGGGFVPPNLPGVLPRDGGFGLHSVFERVTSVGGEMNIDSSPGNGTTVTLSFPCSLAVGELSR